jgi:hypothetical protein
MGESLRVPDGLTMKRHRDLAGRTWKTWARRCLLGLLAIVCVLGLLGVFGQETRTSSAATERAELTVQSPTRVRGGLLYQARFTIYARQELKDAQLVLSQGWADGITINTVEPGPLGEASRDGRLVFDLGHVPQGESFVLYLDFQVNPTTVGKRVQDVELDDGDTHVLTLRRTMRVFP